ncbi:MAG TPA: acyl-CoA dehydrogenase family protein, partial [Candidatus Binatia bacterium]|nr:acyl-CoA dehydrogenase family protein [Candidatus Binatia bacterium]
MLPFFDQDQLSLRSRIRDWTEKNLFGRTDQRQDVEVEARELVRQLGSAGFLTYTVPRTFDGTWEKVQARDLCILREELSRCSALAD